MFRYENARNEELLHGALPNQEARKRNFSKFALCLRRRVAPKEISDALIHDRQDFAEEAKPTKKKLFSSTCVVLSCVVWTWSPGFTTALEEVDEYWHCRATMTSFAFNTMIGQMKPITVITIS